MKKILPLLLLALAAPASAQSSARETLPPLLIQDSPLTLTPAAGLDTSLAACLQHLPGIHIIPQGLPGGSSDLSIRGSAFSAAGLSFAGVSLRNAQTEHFHTDFPFPAWWLAEPALRTGTLQAAAGEGHLTGTVALSPLPVRPRRVLSLGTDSEAGLHLTAALQHTQPTLHNNTFGLGAFAAHLDTPNVDSLGNDLQSTRTGAQIQHHSPHGQTDLWLGYQEKTFGTTGYYGVNPNFNAEETTEDTLLLGTYRSFNPDAPLELSLLLREFTDDYRLDLPTGLFRNQHTTDTRALELGTRHPLTDTLGLNARASLDTEDIRSTNLGNFTRTRATLTLLPDLSPYPALRILLGARGELLEDDDNQLLPLARLEFTPADTLLLYADYAQSARLPSYTELNYESPGSLGNSGLGVQTQQAIELGAHWQPAPRTFASAALFHHQTDDTVDWIRPDPAAARWLAANIGTVTTLGAELLLRQGLTPQLDLTAALTLLDKDADNAPYASRYALDYAKQLLTLQLDWHLSDHLRLEAAQTLRNQADNALRTRGGDQQFLTTLALHARPASLPRLQFSLSATNLLDDNFRPFAGQDTVAERRLAASASIDW